MLIRAILIAVILMLGACSFMRSPPAFPQEGQAASAAPQAAAPGSSGQSPAPGPAGQPPSTIPTRPAPRQYHLGAAATTLVAQAHKQMAGGDFGLAAATIERAMRIEPDNPLLWIELGRVRYTAGDYSQAESMGRKALALATGDAQAQSSAWRLIADALRSLRRNQEAAEADQRAEALSPH